MLRLTTPHPILTTLAILVVLCSLSTRQSVSAQPHRSTPTPSHDTPIPAGTEVTIFLTDGSRYTGILDQHTDNSTTIFIANIPTTFDASDVQRIVQREPVVERYRAMREAIPNDDTDQLLRLIRWLRDREQYELALAETLSILAAQPNHPQALQERRIIEQLIILSNPPAPSTKSDPSSQTEPETPLPSDSQTSSDASSSAPPLEPWQTFPLLTDEQINLIKVYESDLSSNPRLLPIDPQQLAEFLDTYKESPLIPDSPEARELYIRKPSLEILELMFRLQARDHYHLISYRQGEHPPALRTFRDNVHARWLVNSCATTDCHGGADAGNLQLFPLRPRSDEATYTNFLILDRYRLKDGTPLINYTDPLQSPLIHLALQRNRSAFPHPPVPSSVTQRDTYKPVFRSLNDRRVRATIEWIEKMYQPRPKYPIIYPPTTNSAAASPSSDPSSDTSDLPSAQPTTPHPPTSAPPTRNLSTPDDE